MQETPLSESPPISFGLRTAVSITWRSFFAIAASPDCRSNSRTLTPSLIGWALIKAKTHEAHPKTHEVMRLIHNLQDLDHEIRNQIASYLV